MDFVDRFRIGDKQVGRSCPCFVIAEAGVAHFGKFEKAVALVDLAKDVFSEGHSVFILTARSDCASSAIAEFLQGFGIVAKQIHCVGSANGGDIAKAKRKVLLSVIENFDQVWFFDDDDRNIELAKDLPLKAKKV